jgi:hypothetical protein
MAVVATSIGTFANASDELECPLQPKQFTESGKQEINLGVGKIKSLNLAELRVKLEKQQQETFSKLRDGDKIYQEQMFLATYCTAIKSDKSLSGKDRIELFNTYIKNARNSPSQNTTPIKSKNKLDAPSLSEKISASQLNPIGLQIRVSRDFSAPISLSKDSTGQKAIVKFDVLLSNVSSNQFSIIDWYSWEQVPTENEPNAGRMFQPKLSKSDAPEKDYEFPFDLPAGSTKKLLLFAPYDIPENIWKILAPKIKTSETIDYDVLESFLNDSEYRAWGQLKLTNTQSINMPEPRIKVMSYSPSEFYQCFAISFTLANNQRIGAQFELQTSGDPQQLTKFTAPNACKNSSRRNIFKKIS